MFEEISAINQTVRDVPAVTRHDRRSSSQSRVVPAFQHAFDICSNRLGDLLVEEVDAGKRMHDRDSLLPVALMHGTSNCAKTSSIRLVIIT
jgi:hypothetical protein